MARVGKVSNAPLYVDLPSVASEPREQTCFRIIGHGSRQKMCYVLVEWGREVVLVLGNRMAD